MVLLQEGGTDADEYGLNLLNLGSCGLHIVNGAFQKGLSSTGLKVDGFLRAIYQLLHECPARQKEYFKVTNAQDGLLPLSFCPTRWVENAPVLERALQILPNLATYVSAVGGRKTQNPDTKSFDEVCQALKNHSFIINCFIVLLYLWVRLSPHSWQGTRQINQWSHF